MFIKRMVKGLNQYSYPISFVFSYVTTGSSSIVRSNKGQRMRGDENQSTRESLQGGQNLIRCIAPLNRPVIDVHQAESSFMSLSHFHYRHCTHLSRIQTSSSFNFLFCCDHHANLDALDLPLRLHMDIFMWPMILLWISLDGNLQTLISVFQCVCCTCKMFCDLRIAVPDCFPLQQTSALRLVFTLHPHCAMSNHGWHVSRTIQLSKHDLLKLHISTKICQH